MRRICLFLISFLCILALASCGLFCQHIYDDACDATCSSCGAQRKVTHDYKAATCTTAATCKICGATDGEALGHTPNEDDGDCTTPLRCQTCNRIVAVGQMEHIMGEDDGICATPVTCVNCSVVLIAENELHKPTVDDGNCMTAAVCGACQEIVAEAKAAHTWEAIEGSTTSICKECGTYKTAASVNGELTFGKAVILGDSYSTFEGVIPDHYGQCYGPHGRHGITTAEQTWWSLLLKETNSELLFNSSYSGSAIAEITYNGAHNKTASFTNRYLQDLDGLDFDTIFILGGTNDAWAGSPIGDVKFDEVYTDEDLDHTVTSLCFLMYRIRLAHPDARIVNIVNNGYFKAELISGMKTACEHYGADMICLNYFEQDANHPNVKGMRQIKDKILDYYRTK